MVPLVMVTRQTGLAEIRIKVCSILLQLLRGI